MNRTLSVNGFYPISRAFEQALDSKQSLCFSCPYKRGEKLAESCSIQACSLRRTTNSNRLSCMEEVSQTG